MPSGTTPTDIYELPQEYGYEDMKIPVNIEVVEALRSQLSVTREEVFRFVSPEFQAAAEEVYAEIGKPELELYEAVRYTSLALGLA